MRLLSLIVALLSMATVGLFVLFPPGACDEQAQSNHEQVLLVQGVVQAGFAANVLRKIEEGDLEKAQQILQFQLARGLTNAGKFANNATTPPTTVTPEVVESLKRARSYVQDHSLNPELIVAADKAINFFNQPQSP